jgi:hypothetical protein
MSYQVRKNFARFLANTNPDFLISLCYEEIIGKIIRTNGSFTLAVLSAFWQSISQPGSLRWNRLEKLRTMEQCILDANAGKQLP